MLILFKPWRAVDDLREDSQTWPSAFKVFLEMCDHNTKCILNNMQVMHECKDAKDIEDTGGKGSITQWVHAEYMEGSETIHPTFTQWVRGGYFSKVPTKVPTR